MKKINLYGSQKVVGFRVRLWRLNVKMLIYSIHYDASVSFTKHPRNTAFSHTVKESEGRNIYHEYFTFLP